MCLDLSTDCVKTATLKRTRYRTIFCACHFDGSVTVGHFHKPLPSKIATPNAIVCGDNLFTIKAAMVIIYFLLSRYSGFTVGCDEMPDQEVHPG